MPREVLSKILRLMKVPRIPKIELDRTQTAIILCGFYLFFSLAGNTAAKATYLRSFVMNAGSIYSLTFT